MPEPALPGRPSPSILLVDDHPLTRAGLRLAIESTSDLRVCGEAGSVSEALAAVEDFMPDLVVTDLMLGGESGLDLTRHLAVRPGAPLVLVLSMFAATTHADAAFGAGARGYVTKSLSDREVMTAIRAVLGGERYRSAPPPAPVRAVGPEGLSERERVVFGLLGRGFAPRHIAEALGISVHTVEAHRERIKAKLGIASSALLVRYAVAWTLDRAADAGGPTPRMPALVSTARASAADRAGRV